MPPHRKRFVLVYSVAAIIIITLLIVVLIVGALKLSAEPTIEDVYTLIQVITGVLGIPFAVIGAVSYLRDRHESRQARQEEAEQAKHDEERKCLLAEQAEYQRISADNAIAANVCVSKIEFL